MNWERIKQASLTAARQDPEIRWALINEIMKSAGRTLPPSEGPKDFKASDSQLWSLFKKTFVRDWDVEGEYVSIDKARKHPKVGPEIEEFFETFKKEHGLDGGSTVDPKLKRKGVVIFQIMSTYFKAKQLAEKLRKGEMAPKDVAPDAADYMKMVQNLMVKANQMDLGDGVKELIKKAKTIFKTLSSAKRAKDAPNVGRGRPVKVASREELLRKYAHYL